MDVFGVRDQVVAEYSAYVESFLTIGDPTINAFVSDELGSGRLWPHPLVGLNPSFEPGETVDELVARGILDPRCAPIFRRGKDAADDSSTALLRKPLHFHRHQQQAIEIARTGASYVLTTGTGSGKSLAYFVPIIDHVLRRGRRKGIAAIVVYPMNALCNSQMEELAKFLGVGFAAGSEPVTFARYTGQENPQQRAAIAANPPDILLTNFMMLELLLTRADPDDQLVLHAADGLQFLVLDELHTYRGRQGADVAMLVRRVRERCNATELRCIGTSATLAGTGTREERQASVAEIASKLFGTAVAPEHVIGETLRPATLRDDPTTEELRTALRAIAAYPADYQVLAIHPLAAWAERAFGVQRDGQGRLERKRPVTIAEAANTLKELTGVDATSCAAHLQAILLAGYRAKVPDTGLPLFAFRLHQFVSRGDTVYASIEPPESRHLAMEGQVWVPDGTRARKLFPLAFCRECGQHYYVVELRKQQSLAPRDLGASAAARKGELESGFIFPGAWDGALENLPEDWLETKPNGDVRVKYGNRDWQPRQIHVAPDGRCGEIGLAGGMGVWFAPAPFRFCLRCGVTYASSQRSEFGKLASLSTEGRSTATTVISLAIVRALKQVETLEPSARKLLSFTDNRQDASLQAGHFNDFIQVGLLRAALYAAVAAAGDNGVGHQEIAQRVGESLELDLQDFASNPEVELGARRKTLDALRDVVGYRIYHDMRRGWRITSPNLEQCGLLRVAYESLPELCETDRFWAGKHDLLVGAKPSERERVCRVVLDTLRRSLAIKVPYLDHLHLEALRTTSYQYLRAPWALEEHEELEVAPAFRVRRKDDAPKPKGTRYARGSERRVISVSAASGLGRFLRRGTTWPSSLLPGTALSAADLEPLAGDLFEVLARVGLVERLEEGNGDLYQLQAGEVRWLAGDGLPPPPDPVTVPKPARTRARAQVNAFFTEFYTTVALSLRGTEAHEHTAQVPAQIRQDREKDFREGRLPVLYCSPTMELGVDIADLNAVNMRNVPPTPANYAQRSGRAGRQGQPALVLTYCSSTSPHDQHFFRRQVLMVAGAVAPPRLDLANEDLVRAHLHAVWLAETGQYLGRSLTQVLDLEREGLPLREEVAYGLGSARAKREATEHCARIVQGMATVLQDAPWYGPAWLGGVMDGALRQFDEACNRYRRLYQAACQQRDQQHAIVIDLGASANARDTATRLRGEAETQIRLLVDEADSLSADFYSYRYFASEGFLPGYNFPRLPLAAFLPGRRGAGGGKNGPERDEFVSRPRFLALSEFGPRSIIYHEGSRYRVNRVILPVLAGGQPTVKAKLCQMCGYGYVGASAEEEVCRECGTILSGGGSRYLGNLLKLDNVSTQRVDRITSDEEERLRQGYEIHTAVRFAEGTQGILATRATYQPHDPDGEPLARAIYAPTATIWRINLGWNRRKDKEKLGFYLDMERGYWSKKDNPNEEGANEADDGEVPATHQLVVPYVEDRRNALLLSTERTLEPRAMISLSYALKRGIESVYQLEDSELAVEMLPSGAEPRRILLYEAAEGGAGVLSRLVQDPRALARVARDALAICHFDPRTGEDRHIADGAQERCQDACYNCLLGFTNQREHDMLDRHSIRDLLLRLADCTASTGTALDPDDLLAALLARCGSELERRFLRFLAARHHRLPDQAQPLMERYQTRPDFFYSDPDLQACLYVDGPYHEYPARQARDAAITARLEDAGYLVIRVQGDESWEAATRQYPWVFGEGLV